MDTINSLREKWHALQLELLIPVELTDDDWKAILIARNNAADAAFYERLPITVAKFNTSVQCAIYKQAKVIGKLNEIKRRDTIKFYEYYFKVDTSKINNVLFGGEASSAEAHIRYFDESYTPELHSDGNYGRICSPFYVSRVGSLPVWYVKGNKQFKASEDVRILFEQADQPDESGEIARSELRKRKILEPLPLGDVALMIPGYSFRDDDYGTLRSGFIEKCIQYEGTLHCSSPVPSANALREFNQGYNSLETTRSELMRKAEDLYRSIFIRKSMQIGEPSGFFRSIGNDPLPMVKPDHTPT